jgi:hypothetical protein
MKMTDIASKLGDSEDRYLLLLGSLGGILIIAIQLYLNEFQPDPLKTVMIALLLVIGLGILVFLRKRTDQVGLKLAYLGAVYIILAYLSWPTRFDWLTWHDQGHYLVMVQELSQGYLTPYGFRMGLGYPLITVPFYLLIGEDGLFIPNLLAFAGTLYFSYLLFKSLADDLIAKISVLFIIFATTLPYHHVIWWNHGPVIFLLIALSYMALKKSTDGKLLLAGAIVGLAFFTRYLDVVVFLPILALIIWRSESSKLKGALLAFVAALPFIVVPFIVQWAVFGDPLMSPYKYSFNDPLRLFWFENIPSNFLLTFVYFPEKLSIAMLGMQKETVLISAFYVIFAPLGAYLFYRFSNKKGLIGAMIASAVICILYSSAFWQFHSGTFGPFPTDFRYLLLAYPYMVFFSIIGLFSFLKIRQFKKETHNGESLNTGANNE